jgi:hypothetical protein
MVVSMRLLNIGNVFTTEYTERQAFCPVVCPPPLTRKRVLLPLFGSKGDTLACGGRGGGTQFRRRDRHPGTLCILYSLYGFNPFSNTLAEFNLALKKYARTLFNRSLTANMCQLFTSL